MKQEITTIRIRQGDGKARYIACENDGTPIKGFERLSDIRKHWEQEIKLGYVELVRELDRKPNLKRINHTSKCLKAILEIYARNQQ